MVELPESLEKIANSNVIFLVADPEEKTANDPESELLLGYNGEYFVIGPTSGRILLSSWDRNNNRGAKYEIKLESSQFDLENISAISHFSLPDGTKYETHEKNETLPSDVEYKIVRFGDYKDRLDELTKDII